MFKAIITLVRNAPAILTAVDALTPKSWDRALDKVKTTAVVAGTGFTYASEPWTAENGWNELIRLGLIWARVPVEIALPAAPVLATVSTFVGSTLVAYVTGWATRESAEKLAEVKPE